MLLLFVCGGTVVCNFFPLLAVFVVLQLHHGLFLACLDSVDLQDAMLEHL